jgi:hypothetical protein
MSLPLYDVLNSSYQNNIYQKEALSKHGYVRDDNLSNHNQQVYYHPNDNKLVFSVTGSHNLKDWGTNMYLAAGKLKDTNRYKEADKTFKAAKEKYKPSHTTVSGHSLGGAISGYIAGKNDDVITLDKGATIGQNVRGNETHYRTKGDVVSLLNSNNKHTVNLENNNIHTGITPVDWLNSHNVSNIKNSNVYV